MSLLAASAEENNKEQTSANNKRLARKEQPEPGEQTNKTPFVYTHASFVALFSCASNFISRICSMSIIHLASEQEEEAATDYDCHYARGRTDTRVGQEQRGSWASIRALAPVDRAKLAL